MYIIVYYEGNLGIGSTYAKEYFHLLLLHALLQLARLGCR